MPEVVTAGETMILGVLALPGRLRHAPGLELKIGGAESNVAIALSRLSLSAGWVGYLSADEPGQIVLDRIRGEGVDTPRVRRLEDAFTGVRGSLTLHGVGFRREGNLVGIEVWSNVSENMDLSRLTIAGFRFGEVVLE